MTSRRESSELVVEWRRRSTSALTELSFSMVIVVVRDEILDCVVGHQLAELIGELGGQRLVVREHEGGALHLFDQPGGRRRLACAGRTEQYDVGLARGNAVGELADGGGLVAARGVFTDDLKRPNRTGRFHASSLRRAADRRTDVCQKRNHEQRAIRSLRRLPVTGQSSVANAIAARQRLDATTAELTGGASRDPRAHRPAPVCPRACHWRR